MKWVSLNARQANDAAHSDEVELALVQIEHPSLVAPIRLSSDNTERLSVEPITYGTRSAWNGANPLTEPYLFVGMEIELPGDAEDAPPAARMRFANIDPGLVPTIRSVNLQASVHIAVMLASSPDTPDGVEYRDLRLIDASYDAAAIEIVMTRRPIEDGMFPFARMTKQRFPGLFA